MGGVEGGAGPYVLPGFAGEAFAASLRAVSVAGGGWTGDRAGRGGGARPLRAEVKCKRSSGRCSGRQGRRASARRRRGYSGPVLRCYLPSTGRPALSDSFVLFIPSDPPFVPSPSAQQAAVRFVRQRFPDADDVSVNIDDEIVFRDAGANFDGVTCPSCGEDLMETWNNLMASDMSGDGFMLLRYPLPCCGAERTLNQLRYEGPQGFSRWEMSIRNPDAPDVDAGTVRDIEQLLGCPVTVVNRRM